MTSRDWRKLLIMKTFEGGVCEFRTATIDSTICSLTEESDNRGHGAMKEPLPNRWLALLRCCIQKGVVNSNIASGTPASYTSDGSLTSFLKQHSRMTNIYTIPQRRYEGKSRGAIASLKKLWDMARCDKRLRDIQQTLSCNGVRYKVKPAAATFDKTKHIPSENT
jgi:hypothetical protein